MVPIQNVPDGCTRASFERVAALSASSGTVQRHSPIRRIADIKTVIGDDELALRVDPPQRAGHHIERMDGGLPGAESRLEQPALDDVEPPGRI